MMPPVSCFRAGPGQSPSLWVRSGAIRSGKPTMGSPEGSASESRPFGHRELHLGVFFERRCIALPGSGHRSAPHHPLRPATVPGRSFPRFCWRQVCRSPAAVPTDPIRLGRSAVVYASVAGFSIPWPTQAGQTGRQSRLPVPAVCSDGTALR